MAKPCCFCSENATREVILDKKYHTWVMNPFQPYPICDICLNALDTDSLIPRITSKWEKLKSSREEEKRIQRASKRLERISKGENAR